MAGIDPISAIAGAVEAVANAAGGGWEYGITKQQELTARDANHLAQSAAIINGGWQGIAALDLNNQVLATAINTRELNRKNDLFSSNNLKKWVPAILIGAAALVVIIVVLRK